jgi:hypothetical protein
MDRKKLRGDVKEGEDPVKIMWQEEEEEDDL